jgi:hypothetical protein
MRRSATLINVIESVAVTPKSRADRKCVKIRAAGMPAAAKRRERWTASPAHLLCKGIGLPSLVPR